MQVTGRTADEAATEVATQLELGIYGHGGRYFFAAPPLDPDWGEVRIEVERISATEFVATPVGDNATRRIGYLEGTDE